MTTEVLQQQQQPVGPIENSQVQTTLMQLPIEVSESDEITMKQKQVQMKRRAAKQYFDFGTFLDSGKPAFVDLPKLTKTRAVIQASSGAGKSWTLRKMVEEFHGYVQQIIIDPEGEFSSLRDKFAFLLATAERGEDGNLLGEIQADPSIAAETAITVLRTKASIILDISELSKPDRRKYVKNFVDALVGAPRELWHPLLVWLDEAHDYASQSGHGKKTEQESEDCLNAVRDLASKGRKRGFCLILASQRISKVDKDVIAEMKNYAIGNTNLDNDQERAADILGLTKKEQRQELRLLEPGTFWVSGSAFDTGLARVKVGKVITHHPEAAETGSKYIPPPTPEELKPVLESFREIPQVKQRNLDERKRILADNRDKTNQILSLQARLRNAEKSTPMITPEKISEIERRAIDRTTKTLQAEFAKNLREINGDFSSLKKSSVETSTKLVQAAKLIQDASTKLAASAGLELPKFELPKQQQIVVSPSPRAAVPFVAPPAVRASSSFHEPTPTTPDAGPEDLDIGKSERAVLKFLAMRPGKEFTEVQVGAMTLYSPTSGGFRNTLSKLKTLGFIRRSAGRVSLVEERIPEVIDVLGSEYSSPEKNSLEEWLRKLGGGSPRKIYEVLLQNPDQEFTKEEVAERTGYSATSGGFRNSISSLVTLGLAERFGENIRLNRELIGV